jgi:hypothetical protein
VTVAFVVVDSMTWTPFRKIPYVVAAEESVQVSETELVVVAVTARLETPLEWVIGCDAPAGTSRPAATTRTARPTHRILERRRLKSALVESIACRSGIRLDDLSPW